MWDATQEAQGARGRPAATLVSVVSEDERHTKRHTGKVRLTVLEDMPGLNMRPVQSAPPELEGIVPRTVHAEPGDELIVSQARAERLESTGKAVRVDTSKIGAGQKRLLSVLLELAREREARQAESKPLAALGRHFRVAIGKVRGEDWRSPVASTYVGDEPETEGDALRRMPSIRIPWEPALVIERYGSRVTTSALSQALRHLERRGLVLRDVPWGKRGRTGAVELTAAGWRIAADLAHKR